MTTESEETSRSPAPSGGRSGRKRTNGARSSTRRGAADATRQVLEQSIDAVVTIDAGNRVTFFNAAAERLWGYSAEQVLGENVAMLVPAIHQARHDEYVNRHRETSEDRIVGSSRVLEMVRADGEERHVSLSLSRIDMGDEVHYTAFLRDVSDDVRLREQAETLSLVAENTDAGVLITDAEGRVEFVNEAYTRLSGYTLEELRGRTPGEVLQGADTDQETVARIRAGLEAREPILEEILNYTKAGEPYWISLSINPVSGADGELAHFVSIATNIDEFKRASLQYTAKLESVSRSSAVLELGLDGTVLAANRNFLTLLGQADGDALVGGDAGDMIEDPGLLTILLTRISGGQTFSDEVAFRAASGDVFWLDITASPILDLSGAVERVYVYGRDVTADRQTRERAEEQRDVTARVLAEARRVVGAITSGDLAQRIEGHYEGDFAELKDALNGCGERLESLVSQIGEASRAVSENAQAVARGSLELSQRTEEQASSLEETASSMEEMTATVRANAESAVEANRLSRQAQEKAQSGGAVVNDAITAMQQINQASKRIADIISVIDEIAFQTNLLALNAAVEAARAGEQGRGFAVVAGEVRNLAQRSAEAAKEIKGLIKDSVEKVEDGTRLVNESGSTLGAIVDSVTQVAELIDQIATASSEQSEGVVQIGKAVSQMDQMTQQNAAMVEESASAGEALEAEAQTLLDLVRFFSGGDAEQSDERPAPAPEPASTRERRRADRPWADRSDADRDEAPARPIPLRRAAGGDDDSWTEF